MTLLIRQNHHVEFPTFFRKERGEGWDRGFPRDEETERGQLAKSCPFFFPRKKASARAGEREERRRRVGQKAVSHSMNFARHSGSARGTVVSVTGKASR
jgi:hypothetical protein